MTKPPAAETGCHHIGSVDRPRSERTRMLEAADARCVTAGESWSDARRRTYDLLLETRRPHAAYDLIRRFAPGRRPPGPATVYRALDSLIRLGLVHRLEGADKFIACAKPGDPHTAVFLICDCCGCVDELSDCDLPSSLEGRAGFNVRTVLAELHGLCRRCRGRLPVACGDH